MTIDIATPFVLGFLLASVRAAAWLFFAPPFSSPAIPSTVKAMIAVALALPVVPKVTAAGVDLTATGIVTSVVLQVFVGAALGCLTNLMFSAVEAAGNLIDLFGGFTLATAYDPLSMSQNSIFGKLHGLLATTLLFALNLHIVVIHGFMRSYDVVPLNAGLSLTVLSRAIVPAIGQFFVAGIEIAAPLVAVLFLSDIGLGLLTRVAPSLNAFSLAFPVKILLTLALVGMTFPMLPSSVTNIVDHAVRAVVGVSGA